MPDEEAIDFSLMDDDTSTPVEGNNPGIADAASVDIESFMDDMGFVQEGADIDLSKPWMKYHKFELVKQVGRLREVIDEAIKEGRCALDLETQGFDNRIEYDEAGKPYTRHQIVGYCLGIDGRGYYVPVRHKADPVYRSDSPNIDNVKEAEKEITRLCVASQPILTEEAKQTDPLSGKTFVEGGEPKVVIEFWHSKFDQEFLYPITGIDWWHPDSFEDGMLANYVRYTDDEHGLKENAYSKIKPIEVEGEKYHYEMIKFDQLFPSGMKANQRKFEDIFPEEDGNGWNAVLYGCSDGICTNLLCSRLVPYVNKNHLLANTYRLEKQVVQAVRILERQRILINKDAIMELLEEAEREFQEYESKIVALAAAKGFNNFNPGSSSQLGEFLFTENGLDLKPKPERTAEGQFKTDEKTIDSYVENIPNAPEVLLWIVKYRQISKVKGTYLKNLANNTDELNQLRLNFKQTGAATGRFTAPKGDPDHGFAGVPIQGIPARDDPKKPKVAHSMRRLFIARPGYKIIKVDYASQELRIASNVSGERKWIAEYEKEAQTGEPADLHFLTAMAFFPGLTKDSPDYKLKRGMGKTANFALVYGGGVGAVQRATGCDKHEGARLKAAFDESVPQFSAWVKKQHKLVKEKRGVYTAFRRFISIPDANITPEEVMKRALQQKKPRELTKNEAWKESKRIQSACERKSTNFPIQGSGADILKISLVMLIKELVLRGWLREYGGDDSVRLVMTVHDEVVFEVKEERIAQALPILLKIMEFPTVIAKWKVPLIAEAEIGDSWSAKLDWLSMLRGDSKHPMPDYMKGQTIERDPELLVLGAKPEPTPRKEPIKLPAENPQPVSEVPKEAPSAPPAAKTAEKPAESELYVEEAEDDEDISLEEEEPVEKSAATTPSTPPPSTKAHNYTHYAIFQLNMLSITDEIVVSLWQALELAYGEAIKLGKESELVPIEFRDCYGDVCYSARELYASYPEELGRKFREWNLGSGKYELVEFQHA